MAIKHCLQCKRQVNPKGKAAKNHALETGEECAVSIRLSKKETGDVKETVDAYVVEDFGFKRKTFVDNLFANNFNVTQAYKDAYDPDGKKGMSDNSAAANGSMLIRNDKIKAAIHAKLVSQEITEDWIKSEIVSLSEKSLGDTKTYNVAMKGLELLAKMGGYVKPDGAGDTNFFQNNMLVFQPIVTDKRAKELDALVAKEGRIIE